MKLYACYFVTVKIASVFYRDLSTVLATNSSQMR